MILGLRRGTVFCLLCHYLSVPLDGRASSSSAPVDRQVHNIMFLLYPWILCQLQREWWLLQHQQQHHRRTLTFDLIWVNHMVEVGCHSTVRSFVLELLRLKRYIRWLTVCGNRIFIVMVGRGKWVYKRQKWTTDGSFWFLSLVHRYACVNVEFNYRLKGYALCPRKQNIQVKWTSLKIRQSR